MDIANIQKEIHSTAVDHGWWDNDRSFGEVIALIHSELSEALEEWRQGNPHVYEKNGKPEGIGIEFADAIIRILDVCEVYGIDIEDCVRRKMEYNKTRPYRHGGLRA